MTGSVHELPSRRPPGSLSDGARSRLEDAAGALALMPTELARAIDVVGIDEPPALVSVVAGAIAEASGLEAELLPSDPISIRFSRVSRGRSGTGRR